MIGRANRAVALFDGVLFGIANAEVLLSPLTTQEAVLSSKIEGTQATLGEVLEFEAGAPSGQDERQQDIHEILNYRKALREAEQELKTRPFTLNLLRCLHAILLDSVRGLDKSRGQFRRDQNWIGAPGTSIDQAVFVPPSPLILQECLNRWEAYYHATEVDPLVQLAVLHAQFEIIHPFLDGNGRLGRIIIPLFLHEKGLLSRPMFYLSDWLEARRDEYVRLLRELGQSEGSWNRWIIFFLTGMEQQAAANTEKARAIIALYNRLKAQIIDLTHSQYGIPLLDQIFNRPVFRSTQLQFTPRSPSRAAIAKLLGTLNKAGIVKIIKKGSGRRPAVYAFTELINLSEGREVL